ncbi:hypothetical protein [Roseococcus thiosulfatophilus]|uniref:hypothetical protein n=1 Tax=Roseococcus thiosulfatophilus TaxID=35813 RepID=UPI001A8C10BB|nr:hypothetical protein [Roseococcus thiosulfatophilus]
MALTIACLHTGASNAALFDAAAAALPGGALRLTHECRPEWLRAPDAALLVEVAALLRAMAEGADAVLLTCSTIGEAVDFAQDAPHPVLRADAALAAAATRTGGEVTVLYAAPSTRASTWKLFSEAAAQTGADVGLYGVPGAWALFQEGRFEEYHAAIAKAARGRRGRVALAQASMAPAAALLAEAPPLTVPGTAVMAAARAALQHRKMG